MNKIHILENSYNDDIVIDCNLIQVGFKVRLHSTFTYLDFQYQLPWDHHQLFFI